MAQVAGTERRQAAQTLPTLALYRASPLERIGWVRKGVSARQTKQLFTVMRIDQQVANRALGLSTATINKKAARGESLALDEGERVMGLARLVGQVEAMVADSGDPAAFDAAGWLADWLRSPLPALGGERPLDYLDTVEGRELLAGLLARMRGEAYA